MSNKDIWEYFSEVGSKIDENVQGNTNTLAEFKFEDFGKAFMAIIEALINLLGWFKAL